MKPFISKVVRSLSGSPKGSNLLSLGKIALMSCLLATGCGKEEQKKEKSTSTQDSSFEIANSKNISDTVEVDGVTFVIDLVSPSLLTKESSSQCGRKN